VIVFSVFMVYFGIEMTEVGGRGMAVTLPINFALVYVSAPITNFIFGPCDLSGSIGELFKIYEKPTGDLIDLAVDRLKKAGKSAGISCVTEDPDQIRYWYDKGINVISCGADTSYIGNGGKRVLNILKNLKP
jgi:hypothetical protein